MMKGQAMVMMIKSFKFILILVVVFVLSGLKGNAQTTDFRARLGLDVQKDITRKLSASLAYEHRFNYNLTRFDEAFIEPGVSYDLLKSLKIGAEWRFILNQTLKGKIEYKQRAAVYIKFKQPIGDFDLNLRTALQYGFDEITLALNNNQNLVSRNSVEVEYNWFGSKFKPFAGYEFYYHINDPNGGIINESRTKAGIAYRFSKKSELSAYYIFDNEFNVPFPVDANIIGIGYSQKF
jgi:predicted porin